MKSVAFVCFNHPDRYSGGRMHALYLALAFAKIGYEVDYYTNVKPIFYKDIANIMGDEHLNIICSKYFLWKKVRNNYAHIIFPPHIGRRRFADIADKLLIYPFIKRLKKKSEAKLWLLDFESPEWKSEVDDTVMHGYRNVIALTKDVDVILSTTKTGMEFARKFYGILNPNIDFKQLYLCVNSKVANDIGYACDRKDQAIVFYRTGEAHKNNEAIVNMVKTLPKGFTLLLIGRFRDVDEPFINNIKEIAIACGITIAQESNVSERRKYELLANSRLLFFSSKFEGYGLPPVEAQYVGTPVICSKLPVLKEVNEYAEFSDFTDIVELSSAVKKSLLKDSATIYKSVSSFASIDAFCNNLQKIAMSVEFNNSK